MKFKHCGLFGAIVAVAFFCRLSSAAITDQSVSLAWDGDTTGLVAGYAIYYGQQSQDYTTRVDVGTNTQVTLNDLMPQSTNYFVVVAYDQYGDEGPPSGEIAYVMPVVIQLSIVLNFSVIAFPVMNGHWYEIQASTDMINWADICYTPIFTANGGFSFADMDYPNNPSRFYRVVLH